MAPDYDHLTLLHKVEVFRHALECTQGDDLAKILWIKSPSSEVSKMSFFIVVSYVSVMVVSLFCHADVRCWCQLCSQ